ncbi:hypothetical protein PInf_019026 [Phytophthora infestans]|nr:hypothetical protein PInf_004790 [Phytophthora infestans]KAI9991345.1 hypothetical protein PInf_019026 [Phytophthora infestans]
MEQVKIPAKHVQQASLLTEAQAEPLMWKPAFSTLKCEKVLECSRRLLSNNTLLFKLVRWVNFRVEHNRVQPNSVDIRDTEASLDSKSTMTDSSRTLEMLFSDALLYLEPGQTAIFMQMKEAFRLADKDCSGEIDADEVADMLETIVAQSGTVKQGEIHKYVEEFMRVVDKDNSGLVSFEELVEALENGLKLEVEVYTQRKPKASVLVARPEHVLVAINENEDDAGDASENDEPKVEANVNNSRAAMPSRESYRNSSQASSVEKNKRVSSAASSDPAMCREHDVLNVKEFSSSDIAAQMKTAYVEWLLEERRYEKVSMEEPLLLTCLVSGAGGIAKSLTEMAAIVTRDRLSDELAKAREELKDHTTESSSMREEKERLQEVAEEGEETDGKIARAKETLKELQQLHEELRSFHLQLERRQEDSVVSAYNKIEKIMSDTDEELQSCLNNYEATIENHRSAFVRLQEQKEKLQREQHQTNEEYVALRNEKTRGNEHRHVTEDGGLIDTASKLSTKYRFHLQPLTSQQEDISSFLAGLRNVIKDKQEEVNKLDAKQRQEDDALMTELSELTSQAKRLQDD